MTTVAKILIAIVFVLSNVFLGFTLAAVNDRDDNPKYRYMRERWMREVVQFDNQRLQREIARESGENGERPIKVALDQLEAQRDREARAAQQAVATRSEQLQEIRQQLRVLHEKKLEIGTFASTMRSFREALESVVSKYMNLQADYQDAVRQFESLAVEREELKVERARIQEDMRAVEEVMYAAQQENADLADRISAMVRQNPALPDLVRNNGRMVRGRVQSAGEPPSDVVVLDVGSQHGVVLGQRFSIYDSTTGDFKAQIVIRRVTPTTAVGMLEQPYRNARILPNDEARRSSIFLRRRAMAGEASR